MCVRFKNKTLNFVRDMFQLDDWDDRLQEIKESEDAVRSKEPGKSFGDQLYLSDGGSIHDFFRTKYLEALSLLRYIAQGCGHEIRLWRATYFAKTGRRRSYGHTMDISVARQEECQIDTDVLGDNVTDGGRGGG